MQTTTDTMGGLTWKRYFTEDEADLSAFCQWVLSQEAAGAVVGVDSETTGLDTFVPGFRLRLVQFGNADEAWLIPAERGDAFQRAARWALRRLSRLVLQNAPFDGLVFDRHLGVPLDELWPKVTDTKILAHLTDSRQEHEGGVGLSLKPLSAYYVDPGAEDGQRELVAEFRAIGHTKGTGWAAIDLENAAYQRYAAADVVLVSRLLPKLEQRCSEMGVAPALVAYEHRIARIGAVIERRGMRVDVEYTRALVEDLEAEAERYATVARRYGVESVNSPKQVSAALVGMGETLTETTDTGALAVGKEILLPLADLDRDWNRIGAREPNKLADAVLRSKRAGKWATSYARAMLDSLDADGHIHPKINTLGARTARWSVSGPPLQQLPSSDWRIRRCIVAPPAHVVGAADFKQVELRVLAALANAKDIVAGINRGEDLHDFTTRLVFGIPEDEPVPPRQRKLCKTISLGKAYAGGAVALSRQTGLPLAQVKQALAAYDRALPAIAQYARYLTKQAQRHGMVVKTPSGRTLRLSRDKSYTAIAYLCQSTARDILGQALCDIEDAGLLPYVMGVVHDEILIYAPEDEADELIRRVGECMDMPFFTVKIESDPEIYGTSWGDGYKCPPEMRYAA
ncbi:DNA polymerase [Nocardiopsis alba]|uniref:DNA polymerase n=1 Tax=Nocardiopsis alba TaxID=53437 RepID=UPI003D74C66C